MGPCPRGRRARVAPVTSPRTPKSTPRKARGTATAAARAPWDEVALVLDMDWAPDFSLTRAAARLRALGVRSTWFVTHETRVLGSLAAEPELFELGIHPSFLPGSSHGSTASEVLAHCRSIVPGARALRTHGLVQSTALLDRVLAETPLEVDASLFLPRTSHLQPVEYFWAGRSLCRLPVFFEDDFEMERPRSEWSLPTLLGDAPGLKVFAFHPIHLTLNGADTGPYQALKARRPRLPAATEEDVADLARTGPGPSTLFEALLRLLAARGGGRRLSQIADAWRARRESAEPPVGRNP